MIRAEANSLIRADMPSTSAMVALRGTGVDGRAAGSTSGRRVPRACSWGMDEAGYMALLHKRLRLPTGQVERCRLNHASALGKPRRGGPGGVLVCWGE